MVDITNDNIEVPKKVMDNHTRVKSAKKVEKVKKIEDSFKNVIENYLGKIVYKFEKENTEHRDIFKALNTLGKKITDKYRGKKITVKEYEDKYVKKSINRRFVENLDMRHMGNYAPIILKDTFDGNRNNPDFAIIKEFINFDTPGYPDMKITLQNDKTVFLEVKITRNTRSKFDSFSFTPGVMSRKKINCNAIHLLFSLVVDELTTHEFMITKYKIVDVSKINIKSNLIFKCNNLEIYDKIITI